MLLAEHKHYYYIFSLRSYGAESACTVSKLAWDQLPVACGMDSIMAFEQLAEVPFKAALVDFSRLSVAESLSKWPESLLAMHARLQPTHFVRPKVPWSLATTTLGESLLLSLGFSRGPCKYRPRRTPHLFPSFTRFSDLGNTLWSCIRERTAPQAEADGHGNHGPERETI